jgi:dTDP-4-dehydrorhamnose 3,5-epimerase
MLEIAPTEIPDVKVIKPRTFEDARGAFCETYNKKRFLEHGVTLEFVQDNESFSAKAGTVRGMHFQSPPFAQDKLVRVLSGRTLNVALDMRVSSPTYRRWVARELSSDNAQQLLVPVGFAHGFCTLEPDTRVLYKVTAHYSPQHDRGFAWNDPSIGIQWPVNVADAVLSAKDHEQPRFGSLPTYFP